MTEFCPELVERAARRIQEWRDGHCGEDDAADTARLILRDASAELARMREALTGWQPIETAPRDGTHIDVWYAPKSPTGEPLIPCRVAYAYFEDGRWWYQNTSNGLGLRLWQEPTHWMPLPEPPAALAQQPNTGDEK